MDETPATATPTVQPRRFPFGSPIAGVCLLLFAPWLAQAADAPATVKLIFVGDIMVAHDEETGRLIERGEDPFEPFAGLLSEADVALGNLECVIAENGVPVPKTFNYLADPPAFPSSKNTSRPSR